MSFPNDKQRALLAQRCLYISAPPPQIPCWYCGQPCQRFHPEEKYGFFQPHQQTRWEYHCLNHRGLDIEVTGVQHELPSPNWFFNRIAIIHNNLRLHWNFYSGDKAHLEHRKRDSDGHLMHWSIVSLQRWPPKYQTFPSDILFQPAEKIKNFLKLYAVFS